MRSSVDFPSGRSYEDDEFAVGGVNGHALNDRCGAKRFVDVSDLNGRHATKSSACFAYEILTSLGSRHQRVYR